MAANRPAYRYRYEAVSRFTAGINTGTGLGEDRAAPQAQATDDEIDRMLREYRKASAWIQTDRREVHEDREELVGRTGLFVPQGEHGAGFYHLSFQEFFAEQRLADGEPEALAQTILERGAAPAWRNALSFLYGKFLAAETPRPIAPSACSRPSSPGWSPPPRRRWSWPPIAWRSSYAGGMAWDSR